MLFPNMYIPYSEEIEVFGDKWCGPDSYTHDDESLVAIYESSPKSDGQTVHVYCDALPARFYTLKVLEGPNSVGDIQPAYEVGTGSGMAMAHLVAELAQAICDGMIGFRQANDPH